jgi:hypothetical protein
MEEEVTPSANITNEKRAVAEFSKLDVSGIFTVYLSIADEESVNVEANENLQSYINVSTQGDILVVKLADNINIRNGEATMNVHVSMRSLDKVSGSGAVEYRLNNELPGQQLMLDLSGSSKFSGKLNLGTLDVRLSGASHLQLSGSSDRFQIVADGASKIEDFSFGTNKFKADLDGASEFHLTVHETMDITASGASVVYYKGDAQITRQNLTGASRIVKMD